MKTALALPFISLAAIILSGCMSINYDSNAYEKDKAKVIVGTREQIEKATFAAIKANISSTKITRIADEDMAYSFYAQPLLDRTEFELTYQPALIQNNSTKNGYTYKLTATGTIFDIDNIYGKPIRKSLDASLAAQGATVLILSKEDVTWK